jgi:hypothetical protein
MLDTLRIDGRTRLPSMSLHIGARYQYRVEIGGINGVYFPSPLVAVVGFNEDPCEPEEFAKKLVREAYQQWYAEGHISMPFDGIQTFIHPKIVDVTKK